LELSVGCMSDRKIVESESDLAPPKNKPLAQARGFPRGRDGNFT
jgi:hypothetical protein